MLGFGKVGATGSALLLFRGMAAEGLVLFSVGGKLAFLLLGLPQTVLMLLLSSFYFPLLPTAPLIRAHPLNKLMASLWVACPHSGLLEAFSAVAALPWGSLR